MIQSVRLPSLGLFRWPRRAVRPVVFLTWYNWIDAPLAAYCRSVLGTRHVMELRREDVALNGTPSSGSFGLDDASPEAFRDATYRGLCLWEVCKSSICDDAQATRVCGVAHRDIIRHFYGQAARLIDRFESLFERLRPRAIVVEQGLQYDMRAAVEVARRQGIRTVAIENSFLRDYFFMDDASGAITNRHRLGRSTWDCIRARALSPEQRRRVHAFLAEASTTFQHPEGDDAQQIREQFGIAPQKRIALLLGQVFTDAAIVMDSDVYVDQVDFMLDAAAAMERHADTHHLVVRLHPKEATGMSHYCKPFANRTLARLCEAGLDRAPHVSIVHSNQMNTYRLMDLAEFGLTLTSQSGLEMLARHKPIAVAGDAFFARKGFTADVASRGALASTLSELAAAPKLSERQKAHIDNFLYALCFEFLLPKSLNGCETRIRELLR